MTTKTAHEVIASLTQGYNPLTGALLEPENILNNQSVLRALFEAKSAIERCEEADRRRRSQPAKTGAAWTPEEETLLAGLFASGRTFDELARELSRSSVAVQARLIKLGKIQDTGQLRFASR